MERCSFNDYSEFQSFSATTIITNGSLSLFFKCRKMKTLRATTVKYMLAGLVNKDMVTILLLLRPGQSGRIYHLDG